jgi:hypothetical protein
MLMQIGHPADLYANVLAPIVFQSIGQVFEHVQLGERRVEYMLSAPAVSAKLTLQYATLTAAA